MTAQLLFIPVSGPVGSGEYMRCRIIAEEASRRWPGDRVTFFLSREAPYANELDFETILTDRSPTFHAEEVNRFIRERRPDIVVFDNSGRTTHLRCARASGARVVYISSRKNKRKKLFRIDRMRCVDQHWIAQPEAVAGALSWWESLKVAVTRQQRPLFLGTICADSDPARRRRLKYELGLGDDRYLFYCHGGGELRGDDRIAPRIFTEAAQQIAHLTGLRAVVVLGAHYQGPATDGSPVIPTPRLSNEHFIDLMHDAELVISGAGAGMTGQVLALGRVCVAIPFSLDQRQRIRACRRLGLLESTRLSAATIRDAVVSLLTDPQRYNAIQSNIRASGAGNGLRRALDALAELRPAGA